MILQEHLASVLANEDGIGLRVAQPRGKMGTFPRVLRKLCHHLDIRRDFIALRLPWQANGKKNGMKEIFICFSEKKQPAMSESRTGRKSLQGLSSVLFDPRQEHNVIFSLNE